MRLAPEPSRITSDDNLIPMINVVFLLLIFYMVAGTIAPPVPIEAEPPKSSQRRDVPASRTLHVGADGAMALDAAPVTLDTLDAALRRQPEPPSARTGAAPVPDRSTSAGTASPASPDSPAEPGSTGDSLPSSLAVRADGELALERLQPVLDALRTAGVIRVELITTWVPAGDR